MKLITKLFIFVLIIFSLAACDTQNNISSEAADEKADLEFIYLFAEAGKNKMFGNTEKAKELYLAALNINPQSAASCYFLSALFADDRLYNDAYKFAKKAVDLNQDNFWYNYNLSKSAAMLTRFSEAEDIIKKMMKRYPDKLLLYEELARIYKMKSDTAALTGIYRKMQERFGFETNRSLDIYDMYMSIGNYKEAKKQLEKVLKFNPDKPKYKALMAEYYVNTFQSEKAKIIYDDILKTDSLNPYVHLSYAQFAERADDSVAFAKSCELVALSPELVLEDKMRLIVTGYEESKILSDDNYEYLLSLLIDQHPNSKFPNLIYAEYLIRNEQKEEAMQCFRNAAQIDYSDYHLIISLFELEYELSKFQLLYEDASEFSEIYLNRPTVFLYKGIAALKTGRFKKAETALKYGVDLAFDDNELTEQFYSYIAESYKEQGEYDAADRYFEKVLSANPLNCLVAASYVRSLAYRTENKTRARELAEFCYDNYPGDAEFVSLLALVELRFGNKSESEKLLIDAQNLDSGNIYFLETQGDFFYLSGKPDSALEYWKKSKKNGNLSVLLEQKIKEKKLLNRLK